MSARVLVFGCDSGDPTTARRLAGEGRAPALARLLDEGTHLRLDEARGGTFVAERWTSMVTGVPPQVHRFWRFAEPDPDRFADRRAPLDPRHVPRLWDRASDAGRRVAVFDVPRQPLAAVNGIHLDGWGTHDDLYPRAWPRGLLPQLDARFGVSPFAEVIAPSARPCTPCDVLQYTQHDRRTTTELRELADLISANVEARATVSEHLLAADEWDLFFTVFAETHCVGHQCWHLRHPNAAREYEQAALLGDAVADTYEAIDASLGRHLALAGPDAIVVLVLHTGMTRFHGGNEVLPGLLRRLGGPDAPYRVAEYTAGLSAIRLRLEGRDPGGSLRPSEATEVATALATELMSVVDERTGVGAVARVSTRSEVFPGVDDDALPDLFVEWNGDHVIEQVSVPGLGTVPRAARTARTGDHTADGLVVVWGAEVPEHAEAIEPEEFAPLVARLLDVDYETGGWSATASASSAANRFATSGSQK